MGGYRVGKVSGRGAGYSVETSSCALATATATTRSLNEWVGFAASFFSQSSASRPSASARRSARASGVSPGSSGSPGRPRRAGNRHSARSPASRLGSAASPRLRPARSSRRRPPTGRSRIHTRNRHRARSWPHSLHFRLSTGIRSLFRFAQKNLRRVSGRGPIGRPPHLPGPQPRPAGLGTSPRTRVRGGCRGFTWASPSTPAIWFALLLWPASFRLVLLPACRLHAPSAV